ncbi:MAG TPA: condensation domain-containing protein, partial [Roseiflexaceae bacterium]|nr:condensation domain-containing protein [Roseiflexaceae bacterium]
MTQADLMRRLDDLTDEQKARVFERLRTKRQRVDIAPVTIACQPRDGAGQTQPSFPLSFAQQRLWFLDQLEPGQAFYTIPLALRLRGALDRAALEASLSTILARHEALRTSLVAQDGVPVQLVAPPAPLPLPLEALDHLLPDQREAAARARASQEAQTPFDLAQGPLVRARLLRLAPDDHALLLSFHHAVSDGWSLGVFLRELTASYQAFLVDATPTLPALPVQYGDYAVWQRDWLQGQRLDQQLRFWQHELAGAPALLELPTDLPRPAVQTFRGSHLTRVLSPALTARLRSLSRQEQSTLFMTLLAAFQVVLARWSGQHDIV